MRKSFSFENSDYSDYWLTVDIAVNCCSKIDEIEICVSQKQTKPITDAIKSEKQKPLELNRQKQKQIDS